MTMTYQTKDFYYDLPKERIAQKPLPDRASSKLMVLDKRTGDITHTVFKDLLQYVEPGDCLVMNDTRVIPARLTGKSKGGGRIELLLLDRKDSRTFEALVKPGKKARPGDVFEFGGGLLRARVLQAAEGGARLLEFEYEGVFEEILDNLGEIPLPPYITEKARDKEEDRERYQTVYALHKGSAAAPTAGLHFTLELLDALTDKGVELARITLHVGLGTFRPVKTDNILEHTMHSEAFHISEEAADKINRAKRAGRRVIAVGTTSCRTLEARAEDNGLLKPGSGRTNIFIYPGYDFKIIDGLVTNFHLPESTLLMLVSALSTRENILAAYTEAIKQEYRFFSYGDAMLIL